jgi:hypothetical protein
MSSGPINNNKTVEQLLEEAAALDVTVRAGLAPGGDMNATMGRLSKQLVRRNTTGILCI